MTDKITQSLINSCKKLYEKNVISYESYIECSNKMRNKDTALNLDSELTNKYIEKKNTLYQQKKNTFDIFKEQVQNIIIKMENPTVENIEFIENNYNNLVKNLKEKIRQFENKLLINDNSENKDVIYKTMLQRNKELSDKTNLLNDQIYEIETMIDKNTIIKDKLSNNIFVYRIIISIIAFCLLFIFYKLFSKYINKTPDIISI